MPSCRLVEAFGSTRRRRQLRQRDEAQVVVDRNADEDRLRLIMGEVAAKAAATGETREEVRGLDGVLWARGPRFWVYAVKALLALQPATMHTGIWITNGQPTETAAVAVVYNRLWPVLELLV